MLDETALRHLQCKSYIASDHRCLSDIENAIQLAYEKGHMKLQKIRNSRSTSCLQIGTRLRILD